MQMESKLFGKGTKKHLAKSEFDKDELRKRLTPIQYRVTQEKITERY